MAVQSSGKVNDFQFYTHFATEQEREAFVATMPKSLKARSYYLHGLTKDSVVNHFGVEVRATLSPIKNNNKNETGIKRFRKFVDLYASQIVCFTGYSNSVKTLEEAIAYVNARDAE